MKDTLMFTKSKDPLTADSPGKIIRLNTSADISTDDEKLVQSIADKLDSSAEQEVNDTSDSENKLIIYKNDFTKVAPEIAITENWFIKRYADIAFTNFYRSLKNTVVISGFTGYGVTTTAMYIAKLLAENRCPKLFEDTKLICLPAINFYGFTDASEIYDFLSKALMLLRYEGITKAIIFFDDFEKVPECFKSEFSYIVEDLEEELNFNLLKFLVGINTEFFQNNQANFNLSFVKDSVLVTMQTEKKLKEIIKVIKPRIDELSVSHSGVKISDEMLENATMFKFAELGEYVNYKSLVDQMDYLFAICEKSGGKRVTAKHLRQAFLPEFRYFEKLSNSQRERIAKHEAGHTVLGLYLSYQIEVLGVKIIGDSGAEGKTLALYIEPFSDGKIKDREAMVARIAFYLAGRVAQGNVDTGAHVDLEKANEMAKFYVQNIGAELGSCYIFDPATEKVSDRIIEDYEDKVKTLLFDGYELAKKVLREESAVFGEIVAGLLKKYSLTKSELEHIWKKYHK